MANLRRERIVASIIVSNLQLKHVDGTTVSSSPPEARQNQPRNMNLVTPFSNQEVHL